MPVKDRRAILHMLIPNFETELDHLHALGPAGFVMAFNYTVSGPEVMASGYPDVWHKEYEERNYFVGDPVLLWSFVNSGVKRWSEIKLPDPRGIMKAALKFDLRYGAVISVKKGRKRSVLSVARGDRELTDTEIADLKERFGTWCDHVTNRAALTDREIEVLKLLSVGHSQREIAETLGIAEVTVKQRAVSATKKLGATNRIHAVAIALQRDYLA
ncbi:autoinducer binding domain-containing protein [uncultured Jannaschia sp.]|uniref:LuxR family transcriptional regulator n=1 Tax=uncultured Jannaschia sp. TaxID=293347 RepID=UPI00260783F8|nr:autoinducer binding domain-containing protein [uncultured Jannaschia sp.]